MGIIAQTTDATTLDKWYAATQGNRYLYATVWMTRWWTIVDCSEWDNDASAMTDTSGTPNVAEENPYLYFVSGKWKYTDRKHSKPLDASTLKELGTKLAHNQVKYWQGLHDNRTCITTPWKHSPPPALSLQAEKITTGKLILRAASNQVLLPGCWAEEALPKSLQASLDLYFKARAYRHHGLHGEEVNGAERVYDGKEPFKGTMDSTHDTRLPYEDKIPPEALRACDRSCGRQIKSGGGEDVNSGFEEMGIEADYFSEDDSDTAEFLGLFD